MEQNNFEKNVRQKMDELSIPPSDSVWTNVEKRINKKEKKRRLIFILFFLILFLLSGGYWLLNTLKNKPKENQQISNVLKTEKDSKAINNTDSSFEKSKITPHDKYQNIDSSGLSQEKTKISHSSSIATIHSENKKDLLKVNEGFTPKSKKDYSKQTNKPNSDFVLHSMNKLVQNEAHIIEIENKIDIESLQDAIQNIILKDTSLIPLKTERNEETLLEKENSSIKKITKNHDKNRWNLGITFSGGASLIGGSLFDGDKSLADMNAGAPSGGSFYYYPSPLKNSTAFIAGIFIEKNISAKTKFSFGLSYKYYSLLNKVGNRIALLPSSQYLNSADAYYSSTNTFKSYKNNFHFLEVPVSFSLKLNRNKQLPFSWNAGINISELISSNALQFQSNPGIYYNDNSMFNKTQFGLSTGLSLTLFSHQKTPFTFGPYFYYGASKLAGKGLYDGKHFSFIGIRTELLFHRK